MQTDADLFSCCDISECHEYQFFRDTLSFLKEYEVLAK